MGSDIIAKIPNPRFSNLHHIYEQLEHRQDMQKMYHDKTANDLPALVTEQRARTVDNQMGKRKSATVLSKCAEPRSYILQLSDGSLKKTKESLNKIRWNIDS